MTQGKFIFILNSNGDSLVTPSFNGDMYMNGRRGLEAIELLKRCKNIKDFEATALHFVKLYKLDANYSDEQLEERDFLSRENIVITDFTYDAPSNGRDYLKNWFSDFLYVLNVSGFDVETKIRENECDTAGAGENAFLNWTFKNGTLTVLDFGRVCSTISCVDENLDDYIAAKSPEMTNSKACEILREFNDWRRGIGVYEFSDDPDKNAQCPYSPSEIGKAIDMAIDVLNKS